MGAALTLYALILGNKSSGAHYNPIVTFGCVWRQTTPTRLHGGISRLKTLFSPKHNSNVLLGKMAFGTGLAYVISQVRPFSSQPPFPLPHTPTRPPTTPTNNR